MSDGKPFDASDGRSQRQIDVGALWTRQPITRKVLLILGVVMLVGLSLHLLLPRQHPENDDAVTASTLKTSMQHTFDSDPRFTPYHVAVVTVSVAKQAGNLYQGIAVVQTPGNAAHTIAVEVTDDGKNVIWHAERGAFDWLKTEQPATLPTPTR